MKCPGQDRRYWTPDDIYLAECPLCETTVEFFKDDITRTCPNCGWRFKNPRLRLGCLQWCPYSDKCQEERESAPPSVS
jgi:anaerobic ribonucleoside-triphosphate reductase